MADSVGLFHQAAQNNNVQELRRLVAAGANKDAVNSDVCSVA
jgi:hypothetical protein